MQTVLITGANRGIGLALCQTYLNKGWHVIGVCRTSTPELAQSGAEVISGIDVTDAKALAQLTTALGQRQLNLVINNAGILRREALGQLDAASITGQFLVNALAPLKVTEALLDHLAPSAKVAFITSRMGSIADNSSGGYYGYRMSKAALNAGAMSLARDLQPRGIAVAILHPGYVQTAMVNFGGDISAHESAQRLSQRIDDLNLDNSGGFWHSNGERLPW
ncbi:SDR family oxidoreductase [Cellvibrio japonicus]|uniref:Oxidoreductase, short chain dehydrogenase/reductase family n=1 Tax=Cellvibrio japonicus (strain Ueda107) TaxID=498211 RepID=B3PKT2_CELJU|nr:SDR family oxidoreductase [Cellvibrio japonicus]ACE83165.1 oxidoreductase, short chain dehydrogenase/reductase family [Cellvibrio japonicus Ueda107]QEI11494.1 SDR family oxidoreductase [Cellvibrio japonicus]QEI15068.1 SDR family oxidoreductase [Cellvibrio japonicus]QEI18648.1 SDR family oxidoreductase [Cellvibrio japonicus]